MLKNVHSLINPEGYKNDILLFETDKINNSRIVKRNYSTPLSCLAGSFSWIHPLPGPLLSHADEVSRFHWDLL